MTDLRYWFHKILKLLRVIPKCGSGYRRKNPRVVKIRPLGCREIAGSNLARSNVPLCGLPTLADGANWHVDHFHLDQFTAPCVPVQHVAAPPVISPSRGTRSDYEYFDGSRELDAGTRAIDQF